MPLYSEKGKTSNHFTLRKKIGGHLCASRLHEHVNDRVEDRKVKSAAPNWHDNLTWFCFDPTLESNPKNRGSVRNEYCDFESARLENLTKSAGKMPAAL